MSCTGCEYIVPFPKEPGAFLEEEKIFNTLSYIDLQNFASDMKCELVMFTGLMDDVCAPSSQFAFYNKFGGKKEIIIYPQHGHEWLPKFMDTVLMKLIY